MSHNLIATVKSFMILGEMPNLQKVTLPKSQLTKSINQNILVILNLVRLFWQVDFLAS